VNDIRWPIGHEPEGAAIHEVNLGRSTASPEAVWARLVDPTAWNDYYSNARDVRHLGGSWPRIELGSRFSWVTFGARVTTEVTEYEPFERLAWTGKGRGARGHHAWLLTPRDDGGTDIRTEETQRGTLLVALRPVHAPRVRRMHQLWVDNLAAAAARL
jgi:polyketide cyclase/dehydrase/lipid transport protein